MESKHDERQMNAQDLVHEQAKGLHCRQASSIVGLPRLAHNYERNGFLTGTAPIDGAIQKVVPTLLRACLLYYLHYTRSVGHLCERLMFESMRKEYYRLYMENDVYTTVKVFRKCG